MSKGIRCVGEIRLVRWCLVEVPKLGVAPSLDMKCLPLERTASCVITRIIRGSHKQRPCLMDNFPCALEWGREHLRQLVDRVATDIVERIRVMLTLGSESITNEFT